MPISINFWNIFFQKNGKLNKISKNAYSTLDNFAISFPSVLNFEEILNLCFNVLICGQIVTVGNGIDEIATNSSYLKLIGLLFHSTQKFWIIKPHSQSDNMTLIIHQILWILRNNKNIFWFQYKQRKKIIEKNHEWWDENMKKN